jgi:CRISPR-associated endonuclease/helicase Cas3
MAFMQPELLAKSDGSSRAVSSELPAAFRHEMLSVSLLDYVASDEQEVDDDLLKHIIAAHHGYARPFAPLCVDCDPPGLNLATFGGGLISTHDRRQWTPAHRFDSGIAERFWVLNRRLGWWGLAYVESLLRLADWKASAMPGRGPTNTGIKANNADAVTGTAKAAEDSLVLAGIDGSNPLGFLAALGAFRVLSLVCRSHPIRMCWTLFQGAWRPIVSADGSPLNREHVIQELATFLASPLQLPLFADLGPNLTITGRHFRTISQQAVSACDLPADKMSFQRIAADFVAAMGCDAITADGTPDALIRDTALRTMSGAGHQHFIAFMRELIGSTDASHLHSALFTNWTYQDPGRGANLRWDPSDDRRYALRWGNPSTDPNMTMRGANRLAIEALPFYLTIPTHYALETTGFNHIRGQGVLWNWPIWSVAVDVETCRSILQSAVYPERKVPGNATKLGDQQSQLSARGIVAVFQSKRITTGKFRNFTASLSLPGV